MVIRVVGAGLAFATQVLLARWMGEIEYGIFLFTWTFGLLFALPCSLGLTQAALRFVPAYLARGEWDRLSGVIRRFRSLVSVGALVGAGAGAGVVFSLGEKIEAYYVLPLYLAMAAVPMFALLNLYSEFARGFGWLGLAFTPQMIVSPLLLLGGVWLLVTLGWTSTGTSVLGITCIVSLVVISAQAIVFERRLPLECRQVRPAYRTRDWLRVALPLLLREGFIVLLVYTDILMLGALMEPGDVAVYGAAAKCAVVMRLIFFAMSATSVPHFAALHAQGRHEELRSLVQSVIRWIFVPSLLVAAGLLAFGKPLLGLFGPAFVEGYTVLWIMVAQNLLFAAVGPALSLLEMTGNQDASAVACAGSAIANVALNAALIPSHGILGAAMATTISSVLLSIATVVLVKRRLGIFSVISPVH